MSDVISLDAIGLKHGTDKASNHHDYLNFYEKYFSPLKRRPIKILEVGVFEGASLATWEEYFPEAQIVGADINPETKRFQRERTAIEFLDQSNIEHLIRLAIKHAPFDVIIEDGSHIWDHQITTLRTLFPFVTPNGLYIVEDLQTNYVQEYRGNATISCVEFLKRWLDLKVGDDQISIRDEKDDFLHTYGRAAHSLTFYRRACLIQKQ